MNLEDQFVDRLASMAELVSAIRTAKPAKSEVVQILAAMKREIEYATRAVELDARGELSDAMLGHIVSLMASANQRILSELPTARVQ